MKKSTLTLLVTMILAIACVSIGTVFASAETKTATVPISEENGVFKNMDGEVYVYLNTESTAKTLASDDYNFRYAYLLVFDSDGKITAVGNNLLKTTEQPDKDFQRSFEVPAGGFAVAFFGSTNADLKSFYDDAEATVAQSEKTYTESNDQWHIYNKTASTDIDYYATLNSDNTELTLLFCSPVVEDSSSEETTDTSTETSSEASSETSSETSSEASSEASDSSSADSSVAVTSSADSSVIPPTGDTGILVFAVLGVLAVVGAAVLVRARH